MPARDQEGNLGFLEKHGFVKLSYEGQMMEARKRRFRETVSLYRYVTEEGRADASQQKE